MQILNMGCDAKVTAGLTTQGVNGGVSVEKKTAIIGTKRTIKEMDQFKVHPNYLKELPANMGYFYSKRKTRMNVKPFKTAFVKVD